jgi:ADP-ribosylglycohydrolase
MEIRMKDRSQPNAGQRDRARGALLGQAVGDALGTTVEFSSPAAILQRFPGGLREVVGGGVFSVLPGQVTDDTELALALARSLAEERGYSPDTVAAAYQDWLESGPFDKGRATLQAFGGRLARGPGLAERLAQRADATTQANGSLMRISPLGIFGWDLAPTELARLAARDSALSHPHPLCQAACAVLACAIALAIREGLGGRELHWSTLDFARKEPLARPAVEVLEAALSGPPRDYLHQQGWVRTALQNAFFQLGAPTFEEGLVDTVNQGGDADTNGAIAGALLGAAHGASVIPARWAERVLSCSSPRPARYHCTDLPQLADRLMQS